ncbi:MAG: DUF2975 domain-containing protein [Actinobacteria bacterium]|nr:DUF2975 domain-containing protein [Actinomycetota bacterium]
MRKALLVNTTMALLAAAIAVEVWVAMSFLIGPWGLGVNVPRFGGWIPEGVFQMHAEGVLAEPAVVDIDLAFTNTSEGATDVSTGLPAAELSGPYTASVNILNPTDGEQLAYVTIGALVPALAAVALWVLLRIVSSVNKETPFTKPNAKRMWLLAALIGIGGTLASFADHWIDAYLISRSAAGPAFQTSQVTFDVWPLIVGLVVGVIALTWDRGVALERDTEGLI